MTAVSPEGPRTVTAADLAAYRPFEVQAEARPEHGRRDVGWVLAAVAVAVLFLALASPLAATAESAGTLVTAMFVLALALGGVALTFLLPARRR